MQPCKQLHFMPRRPLFHKNPARAFTLIELLVVIAIIAVLAGLLASAYPAVVSRGRQTQAMNNMRQVGTAFLLYSNDNNYTLPGRLADAVSTTNPKWPAVLAGTDGSGKQNVTTNYVQNVKVYVAPGDSSINPTRPDLFTYVTTNEQNHCSWIMNGYNDLGTISDPSTQIRTVRFTSPSQTILLGVQNSGAGNFYMDFQNGDNNTVLNLRLYNATSNPNTGTSPYLFADGSVQFITKTAYKAAAPNGASGCYGDWLWLANKASAIPTPP